MAVTAFVLICNPLSGRGSLGEAEEQGGSQVFCLLSPPLEPDTLGFHACLSRCLAWRLRAVSFPKPRWPSGRPE